MVVSVHEIIRFLDNEMLASASNKLSYDEQHKYHIKQHVIGLCQGGFNNLQPGREKYVESGRTTEVLYMSGTIPANYLGQVYNFPVKLVIPSMYPREAPHIFVTPTPDMVISAQHPFVNQSGRVATPYLREWTWPRSQLFDSVADLAMHFGSRPPVHSRPPTQVNKPQHNHYPVAHTTNGARPSQNSSRPSPYPPATTQASSSHNNTPIPYSPYNSPAYPVVNPYANPAFQGTNSSASHANVQPYPTPYGQQPQQQPPQQAQQVAQPRVTSNSWDLGDQFRTEVIKALLARVASSTHASAASIAKETESAQASCDALDTRHTLLQKACLEKKKELQCIERNISRMSTASQQVDMWLQTHEPKAAGLVGELKHGDIIVPVDGLSRQAIDAQAADMAVDDTLAALDSALTDGVIKLEPYLKQVRYACQTQYEKRLLGIKIQGMQKSGVGSSQIRSTAPGHGEVMLPQGDSWRATATLSNPMSARR